MAGEENVEPGKRISINVNGQTLEGEVVEVQAKSLSDGRVIPGWAKVKLDDGTIVTVKEEDFLFD